jgi:hypothetical protein
MAPPPPPSRRRHMLAWPARRAGARRISTVRVAALAFFAFVLLCIPMDGYGASSMATTARFCTVVGCAGLPGRVAMPSPVNVATPMMDEFERVGLWHVNTRSDLAGSCAESVWPRAPDNDSIITAVSLGGPTVTVACTQRSADRVPARVRVDGVPATVAVAVAGLVLAGCAASGRSGRRVGVAGVGGRWARLGWRRLVLTIVLCVVVVLVAPGAAMAPTGSSSAGTAASAMVAGSAAVAAAAATAAVFAASSSSSSSSSSSVDRGTPALDGNLTAGSDASGAAPAVTPGNAADTRHDMSNDVDRDHGAAPAPKRARTDGQDIVGDIYWGDRSQLLDVSDRAETRAALSRLRLSINVTARLATCIDCGCAVGASASAYANHARRHHQAHLARDAASMAVVNQLRVELGLTERVGKDALPLDGPAVQGIVLVSRYCCSLCGKGSDSERVRDLHDAEHGKARVQWTPAAMQRLIKGQPYVRVAVPASAPAAAASPSGRASSSESSLSSPAASPPHAAMDVEASKHASRLRTLLTAAIPRGTRAEVAGAVDDDHSVNGFVRTLGWHLAVDARITDTMVDALVSNVLSDDERRTEGLIEVWVQRLCQAIANLPADDARVLSQVRAFSGEEADGPALRALERGSQAAYVATLSAFLRFLHRVSEATVRTQLAMSPPAPIDRQPTADETAAAFGGRARRPAIDVPDLVRDAIGRLFHGGSVEAIGAAVFSVFENAELCGIVRAGPAAASSARLVRIPQELQLVSMFMRLRFANRRGGLANPDDIGHWAVHLIYAARLAVVERVVSEEGLCQPELQSALRIVAYPNAPSPFDTLVSLRREARAAAAQEPGRPTITDVPGRYYRAVRVLGVDRIISLDDLGDMCRRLQVSVRARLVVLTAGVPLVDLADADGACGGGRSWEQSEFRETTPGRTVVPDRSAAVADALARCATAAGPRPFGPWLTPAGCVDTGGMRRYIKLAGELMDELLVLVHMSSGQPARGTELAALLWRNTATGERNVYLSHGTVMLLQRYSKTRNLTGSDLYVARFLDTETAGLLFGYLAQVRPIETRLLVALAADAEGTPAHDHWATCARVSDSVLFCRGGRPYSDDTVGTTFRSVMATTTVGLGESVGLLQFRHVAIRFARTHLKVDGALLSLMEAIDYQAAHSSQVGMTVYARAFGQRGRDEDERQYFLISSAWQQLLGLHCVPGALEAPLPTASVVSGTERKRTRTTVLATQPTPRPAPVPVAELVAAVSDAVRSQLAEQLGAALRATLSAQSPPTTVPPAPTTATISGAITELSAASTQWTAAEGRAVASVLQQLHGPNTRPPLPELAVALRTVMYEPARSLVAVLPTGSGKSVLVLADALADRFGIGVVVVIVPLRAVLVQLRALCDLVRVGHATLGLVSTGTLASETRILFVPAELVGTVSYRHVLGSLADARRLRRVVFDEVHLSLETDADFRPKLLRALRSMRAGAPIMVPVLLLSATVPPASVRLLQEEAELPDLAIVRASSVRHNVRLTVVRARTNTVADVEVAAADEVAACVRDCASQDRVLVLVMTVAAVARVADAVARRVHPLQDAHTRVHAVHTYHGRLDDDEQLSSAAAWVAPAATAGVMVATSAFGTGVHYAHVRAVVHVGGTYGVVSLVQELGRAGRDLAPALHVLVVPGPHPTERTTETTAASEFCMVPAIGAYAATPPHGCFAQELAREVDGAPGLPCRLGGRVPCGHCEREVADVDADTPDWHSLFRSRAPPATPPMPTTTTTTVHPDSREQGGCDLSWPLTFNSDDASGHQRCDSVDDARGLAAATADGSSNDNAGVVRSPQADTLGSSWTPTQPLGSQAAPQDTWTARATLPAPAPPATAAEPLPVLPSTAPAGLDHAKRVWPDYLQAAVQLADVCHLCLVATGELVRTRSAPHSTSGCPTAYARCFKCLEPGHFARVCPAPFSVLNGCYRCGLPRLVNGTSTHNGPSRGGAGDV